MTCSRPIADWRCVSWMGRTDDFMLKWMSVPVGNGPPSNSCIRWEFSRTMLDLCHSPVALEPSSRCTQQLPSAFVNVQLLINVVARLGLAAKIDPALPRLLERPAGPLHDYLQDHSDLWQRAGSGPQPDTYLKAPPNT